MRHSRNLRSTLRARPHTRHRRTVRVMNFGLRAALILIALLAIDVSGSKSELPNPESPTQDSFRDANGIPSRFKSASARSSRPAVVTIVTFSPFDLSVFA